MLSSSNKEKLLQKVLSRDFKCLLHILEIKLSIVPNKLPSFKKIVLKKLIPQIHPKKNILKQQLCPQNYHPAMLSLKKTLKSLTAINQTSVNTNTGTVLYVSGQ